MADFTVNSGLGPLRLFCAKGDSDQNDSDYYSEWIYFILGLAERVRQEKLNIICVPTSFQVSLAFVRCYQNAILFFLYSPNKEIHFRCLSSLRPASWFWSMDWCCRIWTGTLRYFIDSPLETPRPRLQAFFIFFQNLIHSGTIFYTLLFLIFISGRPSLQPF